MKKALVVGWYSRFNIGDESYKLTFPILFPDYDFVFKDHGSADICILGGGNIVSESYVHLALNCDVKKRFIFSASISKNSPFELLKKFDAIIVRDKNSQELLNENGIHSYLGADAAFCLIPDATSGKELIRKRFESENLELYSKVVGVVLNAHLTQAKDGQLARDFITLSKAIQDIATVADSTPASFVFFPMSTGAPHDDRITNGMISNRCKFWKKNLMIYDRLSIQETLNLVSACDSVISTRLHSTIFSILSETPFVDLIHHDKNESFLQSCNLRNFGLSYWSFGSYDLKNRLNEILLGQSNLKQAKQSQIESLQESLQYVRLDQPTGCDTSDM